MQSFGNLYKFAGSILFNSTVEFAYTVKPYNVVEVDIFAKGAQHLLLVDN